MDKPLVLLFLKTALFLIYLKLKVWPFITDHKSLLIILIFYKNVSRQKIHENKLQNVINFILTDFRLITGCPLI